MKKHVLIVDDEVNAREGLARIIRERDFEVRTAGDTDEATRLMAETAADVVVLDLDLPLVPGDSFAAFLRVRYPKTRILFISGQYDMVNPERFGEQAMYFRKPIDVDGMLEALEMESVESGR